MPESTSTRRWSWLLLAFAILAVTGGTLLRTQHTLEPQGVRELERALATRYLTRGIPGLAERIEGASDDAIARIASELFESKRASIVSVWRRGAETDTIVRAEILVAGRVPKSGSVRYFRMHRSSTGSWRVSEETSMLAYYATVL